MIDKLISTDRKDFEAIALKIDDIIEELYELQLRMEELANPTDDL